MNGPDSIRAQPVHSPILIFESDPVRGYGFDCSAWYLKSTRASRNVLPDRTASRIFSSRRLDLLGHVENLVLAAAGQHYDAIRIPAQEVPRADPGISDVHRHLRGVHLDPVLSGLHGIAARVDRITQRETHLHITAGAVDNRACQALFEGHDGQDYHPTRCSPRGRHCPAPRPCPGRDHRYSRPPCPD